MSTLTRKHNTFVYHTLLSEGEHADIYIDKMVPQLYVSMSLAQTEACWKFGIINSEVEKSSELFKVSYC